MPYRISIWLVFLCFSSSIKSGLQDVVVFRKLNSKSHTNFVLEFLRTCPLFHFFDIMSRSDLIDSVPLIKATAITISALLMSCRYSLLASILHRCCTVTRCSLHNLHRLFSVNTLNLFQALVLTICYNG